MKKGIPIYKSWIPKLGIDFDKEIRVVVHCHIISIPKNKQKLDALNYGRSIHIDDKMK